MANQFIPPTREGSFGSIITDEPTISIQTGPPEPPDDPKKWAVELWTTEDLCKRYKCTADDINSWSHRACYLALPEPTVSSRGWGGKLIWRRPADKVLEWEARMRHAAAHLPKK